MNPRRAIPVLAGLALAFAIAAPALAWAQFDLSGTCEPDQGHARFYIDARIGEPNYVFEYAWSSSFAPVAGIVTLAQHVGSFEVPLGGSTLFVRYRDDHAVSEWTSVETGPCDQPEPTPTPTPTATPTPTPDATPTPTPTPTVTPTPTPTSTSNASATPTATATTPSGTPSTTPTGTGGSTVGTPATLTLPPTDTIYNPAEPTADVGPVAGFLVAIGLLALLLILPRFRRSR